MADQPPASQRVVDGLLALGFLALGWISSGAPSATDPSFQFAARDWLFVLLLVLATVPYARRRRAPAAAFLVSMLAVTLLWLLGYNAGALPALILLGAYFMASACPPRQVVACTLVALGCFGLLWWAGGAPYGGAEFMASALAVGAAVALGRGGRLRAELAEARALAAEETALRRASEERLRIARDVHDIVGHSLGAIAVQAGVGRHLMASDPSKAAAALDDIARVSRSSLNEVRAAVATLREGEPSYHPAPALADLSDLVGTARLAGLTVALELPDDMEGIPSPTGAAVYRITREALTNVARHAHATTASVRVRRDEGCVEVAIRDNGTGGPRGAATSSASETAKATVGLGIIGMRERAEALGGSLSAGPSTEGGFLVTAHFPTPEVSP